MRHWLFHPVVFYPLAALAAALAIGASLRPQSWPRQAAPVAAEQDGQWLVLRREAFNSPAPGPDQELMVSRDLLGRAQSLHIAERPGQQPPQQNQDGIRILLKPETAAAISGRPVTVEVSYNPLPINAATGLAVSLRGDAPSYWASLPAPPQSATLRFNLPAQPSVNAIGVRALSNQDDQAYGLEITRIRIMPSS
jgi:hypothetical protein